MAWAIAWVPLGMIRIHGDPWWDFTIGQWELRHHAIATVNLWGSHALGVRWVNPEWLWGIILAEAAHAGYLGWMIVLAVGMAGYFIGITVLIQQWRLSPTLRALMLLVAVLCAEGGWGFRPQVWAYACAVFGLWFIQRLHTTLQQQDRAAAVKLACGLVGLTVGWAQFHGSWILIPLWLGIEGVFSTDGRIRIFWLSIAAVIVSGVAFSQPWGWTYVTAAVQLSTNPTIANVIPEWMSPNFHHLFGLVVYVGYGITGGWALWVRPQGNHAKPWRRTAYWFGFGLAACYAVRFLPYLPLGLILAWGDWDPGDIHLVPPSLATLAASAMVLVLMVPLGTQLGRIHPTFAQEAHEPATALTVLAAHGYGPGTALFANISWGGYLEWRGYRPWIDTRDNFWSHQEHALTQYYRVREGVSNPGPFLRRIGDSIALVRPHEPLAWGLRADGWSAVWQNAQAILLIAPGTLWSLPQPRPIPLVPRQVRT